ncbi:hypothetical protein HYU92_06670 [Candidatus Curtissbacteria bacterium]|nr:hypothetical protein [Candidatus Curtissbacteria bacterium]
MSSVKCQSGQLIIISLIFITVVLVLTGALFGRTASFLRFGGNSLRQEQANTLAEAGVNYALWQLNKTAGDFGGIGETALGPVGTFEVQIVPKTAILKGIVATGYVPDKTSYRSKRTINLDALVSSEETAFIYAVQVGNGGVFMKNTARITGTVWANANIAGENSSLIDGAAYATGTITDPPCTPGSPPSCVAHPNEPSSPPMPTVDYAYWKDQATAEGITPCPGGICSYDTGSINLGPQQFVGDLDLKNTVTVTMNGPIYVTGNVILQNSAILKLNENFGSYSTVLIADGTITIKNSAQVQPTSANPKGYIMIVTTSILDPAISIQNGGANAVFYALDGGAELQNSAQVNTLVTKKLTMQNSATLTYDSGLASAQFSSGPGGSWQIKKGTYRF